MTSTTATSQLLTFKHGVHPEAYKELTAHRPIERMPFVEEYVVHLSQHLGKPSLPVVQKGQRVRRGQVLAEPDGFVSIPQHAPVTGVVKEIGFRPHPNGQLKPAVVLAADPFDSQRFGPESPLSWETLDAGGFVKGRAGLRHGGPGWRGVSDPCQVRASRGQALPLPDDQCVRVRTVLTADHRTMLERPEQLFDGIRIVRHFLAPEKIYLGIEANKQDAEAVLHNRRPDDIEIQIIRLQSSIPRARKKC